MEKGSKRRTPIKGLDVKSLYVVHEDTKPKLITRKSLLDFYNDFRAYYKIFYMENSRLFFNEHLIHSYEEEVIPIGPTAPFFKDLKISNIFDLKFITTFFKSFQQQSMYFDYSASKALSEKYVFIEPTYINLIIHSFGNKRAFDDVEQFFLLAFFGFPNNKDFFVKYFVHMEFKILRICYYAALEETESYLDQSQMLDDFAYFKDGVAINDILMIYLMIYLKMETYMFVRNHRPERADDYGPESFCIYDYFRFLKNNYTLNEWCNKANRFSDYLTMTELNNELIYSSIDLDNDFEYSSNILEKVQNHVRDFLDYHVQAERFIRFNRLVRHPEVMKFQRRYNFIENPVHKEQILVPTSSESSVDEVEEIVDENSDPDSSEKEILENDEDYLKAYLDYHSSNDNKTTVTNLKQIVTASKPNSKQSDTSISSSSNQKDNNKVPKENESFEKTEVISIYFFKEMKKMSLELLESLFFYLNKREFKPVSIENYWNIDKTILDFYLKNQKKFEGNINYVKHPEKFVNIFIEVEFSSCIEWLMKTFQGFTESDIESILVQSNYDYDSTVGILTEASKGNFGVLDKFKEDVVKIKDTQDIMEEIKEASSDSEEDVNTEEDLEESRESSFVKNSGAVNKEATNNRDLPIAASSIPATASLKQADNPIVALNENIKPEPLTNFNPYFVDYNQLAFIQMQIPTETYFQLLKRLFGNSDILSNLDQNKEPSAILKDLWIESDTNAESMVNEEYEVEESSTVPVAITEEVEIPLDYNELKIWKEMFPQIPNQVLKEKYYTTDGNGEALLVIFDDILAANSNYNKVLENLNISKILQLKDEMSYIIKKLTQSDIMPLKEALEILNSPMKKDAINFTTLKNKVSVIQDYLCLTLQDAEYSFFISNYDFVDATLKCVLDYKTISADLKKKFKAVKSYKDYDASFNLEICKSFEISSNTRPRYRPPTLYPRENETVEAELLEKYVYFVENIDNLKMFNKIFVLKVAEYMNFRIPKCINLLVLLSNLGVIDAINFKTAHLNEFVLPESLRPYAYATTVADAESLETAFIKKIEKETTKVITTKVTKTRLVKQLSLNSRKYYDIVQNRNFIDDTLMDLLSTCVVSLSDLEILEALYLVALSVEKWWSEEERQRTNNKYRHNKDANHTLCHYIWPLDIVKSNDENQEICEEVCRFLSTQEFLFIVREDSIEVVGKINKQT